MAASLHVDAARARKLLREIMAAETFTAPAQGSHARREMEKDRLTDQDLLNALRAGVVETSELENGSWRHRVKTNTICVVVALVSEKEAVVVTAWRIRRR